MDSMLKSGDLGRGLRSFKPSCVENRRSNGEPGTIAGRSSNQQYRSLHNSRPHGRRGLSKVAELLHERVAGLETCTPALELAPLHSGAAGLRSASDMITAPLRYRWSCSWAETGTNSGQHFCRSIWAVLACCKWLGGVEERRGD